MLQLAALRALPLKWIGLALLVAALGYQTARIEGFKVWPISIKGLKAELAECAEREKKAAEDAEKQKQTTADNIAKTRDRIVKVEVPAKRVENAPLHPREQCKTPDEIMGSQDL